MIDEKRLVAFVLFAHARDQWLNIYKSISHASELDIRHVMRHRFRGSRALISALYSHDYAPLHHLRSKTRYLQRVGNEVLIIFAHQQQSKLVIAGSGRFAHQEDRLVNDLKWEIRRRWNPRQSNGEMLHHHVIHATDTPDQAHHLAENVSRVPLERFTNHHGPGKTLPYHLPASGLRVFDVPLNRLRVRLLPDLTIHSIRDTPHHLAVEQNNSDLYWTYISGHLGSRLCDGHSWHRFMSLKAKIERGETMLPIIVGAEGDDYYIVRDGVHRLALLEHFGKTKAIVALQTRYAKDSL